MKRKPTFLEAISTIIVMVIVVTIGFVKFNIPIQVLLLIASTYAAFIAMRVGLTSIDNSYACYFHYFGCRYHCR